VLLTVVVVQAAEGRLVVGGVELAIERPLVSSPLGNALLMVISRKPSYGSS
jgi:hypothetical protein